MDITIKEEVEFLEEPLIVENIAILIKNEQETPLFQSVC